MKVKSWMALEPICYTGILVSTVIVYDKMQVDPTGGLLSIFGRRPGWVRPFPTQPSEEPRSVVATAVWSGGKLLVLLQYFDYGCRLTPFG
jgi:hypothetical protein